MKLYKILIGINMVWHIIFDWFGTQSHIIPLTLIYALSPEIKEVKSE